MYENGEGTNKDLDKAKILYKKAADQGSEYANKKLIELKE